MESRNSTVLIESVYNYSWALFPNIGDEIRLYVAFDSDLDYVSDTMLGVAKAHLRRRRANQMAPAFDSSTSSLRRRP